MKTHKDLEAWKNSMVLVTRIYGITRDFPKEEIFGLISQIRRASVSVPSNISEGAARNTKKEFIWFLGVAMGSLTEVETQLLIASNLHYFKRETYEELAGSINLIRAQISGLMRSVERRMGGDKVTR